MWEYRNQDYYLKMSQNKCLFILNVSFENSDTVYIIIPGGILFFKGESRTIKTFLPVDH